MTDTDPDQNEEMFLLEGTLSNLKMAQGRVNLLKKLKVGSTKQNLTTGLAGALGDMPALAANAAILQSYEGESAANFGGYIDDHIVIGQFAGAHLLNNGDKIKAVVSRQDNVLYVHAIQRPEDGLLWLPVGENMGIWATFKSQMRFVGWTFTGTTIFILIVSILYTLTKYGAIDFGGIQFLILLSVFLILPMGLWVFFDLRPLAVEAEKIFKTLGFPKPSTLDMRDGSYTIHHRNYEEDEQSVFYYQPVLDARRTGKKVKIDVPSQSIERARRGAEGRPELDEAIKRRKAMLIARAAEAKTATPPTKNEPRTRKRTTRTHPDNE